MQTGRIHLSLGSAMVAEAWIEAHDLCGRKRS